jgi:hypothetical protein
MTRQELERAIKDQEDSVCAAYICRAPKEELERRLARLEELRDKRDAISPDRLPPPQSRHCK